MNSKYKLYFVMIILLGLQNLKSQNIFYPVNFNTAGKGAEGSSVSAVFSLGEVFIGSISNQSQYSSLSLIQFNGKLITHVRKEIIDINIFPNPVYSKIHLTYNQEISGYRIINSFGKLVMHGSELSDKSIDVSELIQGVYLIQVFVQNNGPYSVGWFSKIDN